MGDTPVALYCFFRTNLSPIFGEMVGQGRDPLVLHYAYGCVCVCVCVCVGKMLVHTQGKLHQNK